MDSACNSSCSVDLRAYRQYLMGTASTAIFSDIPNELLASVSSIFLDLL